MIKCSKRIENLAESYVSAKLRALQQLESQRRPIFNLAEDETDLKPSSRIIEKLNLGFQNDGFPPLQGANGLLLLREAMASFYRTHYKVALSPLSEILPLQSYQESLMHISIAFLNVGDEVLIPNPGGVAYAKVSQALGVKVRYYNLSEAEGWLPDVLDLEGSDVSKVKLMWVSYPHMPSGARATNKAFETLIAFAQRHKILIINDQGSSLILNPYPRSILKYRNAKQVCLELNMLSEMFNLSGLPVSMLSGDERYIQAVLNVRSHLALPPCIGIQNAMIEALQSGNMWFVSLNSVYEDRRTSVWELAKLLKCSFDVDATGFFVWAKLPEGSKSIEFADRLMRLYGLLVVPGIVFGSQGEGYIRFSLSRPVEQIKDVIQNIRASKKMKLI